MEHTREEILEGNELIAEFMGIKTQREQSFMTGIGNFYVIDLERNQILFHNSWDWMFPAIDKINGLGKAYSFATFKTYVSLTVEKSGNKMYKDFSFAHAEYITAEQTGKEAAFKLLVKFIKWHNEHVKQLETI